MAIFQRLALLAMDFPERLVALRKDKGLTQQALADLAGVHVAQIRRYEAGDSQPTLDVIRKRNIIKELVEGMIIKYESKR